MVEAADDAERLDELVVCSGFDASEMGLEFGECHFDGVQVWRIGWQEQEPALLPFQQVCGFEAFVGGQVVEDDDGPGFECRGKLGFDVGVERGSVHGTFDDPGCDQVGAGQSRDEGLGLPFAEWRCAEQAFTLRTSAAQPGHIGLHAGFVNEHKAMRFGAQTGLASRKPVVPDAALLSAPAFLRDQAFFYMTVRPGPAPGGSTTDRPSRHGSLPERRTARAA